MSLQHPDQKQKSFEIAIVGGGIGGIALAIGLIHRNIPVQVYEAARAHAEIGAGIAFGPNSVRAMSLIDPALKTIFNRLATKNADPEEEETWINFRRGFGNLEEIAKVRTSDDEKTGLSSLHRAHFLNDIAKLVPTETIHFGKRLSTIAAVQSGRYQLLFEDGSTGVADAVIGCDGIRSRVRQLLLDKKSSTEDCSFSGKFAFRGLVPMAEAEAMIGKELAGNSQMYLGPGRSVLTYPIDGGKILNVVAFQTKADGVWEHEEWVLPNKRDELLAAFEDWAPPIQKILEMTRSPAMWALFDHAPATSYYQGGIAIMGDAAHASTPHQGAGAGQAMEDALIMCELLADSHIRRPVDVSRAFHAYDSVRRLRSQRVVASSRAAGELYGFQGPAGDDLDLIKADLLERYQWIWDDDMHGQLHDAKGILADCCHVEISQSADLSNHSKGGKEVDGGWKVGGLFLWALMKFWKGGFARD